MCFFSIHYDCMFSNFNGRGAPIFSTPADLRSQNDSHSHYKPVQHQVESVGRQARTPCDMWRVGRTVHTMVHHGAEVSQTQVSESGEVIDKVRIDFLQGMFLNEKKSYNGHQR